jgi:Ca2+:H+ antiporter
VQLAASHEYLQQREEMSHSESRQASSPWAPHRSRSPSTSTTYTTARWSLALSMADPAPRSTPLRAPIHRSTSQASWSEHHNAGTSYQSTIYRPTSPSPRRPPQQRRLSGRPNRSLSVGSARVPTEEDEDEDRDGDEDGNGDSDSTPSPGELDDVVMDEGDDEDEDPITLKDRQLLINVEHPFGLRIWKPALYKKSRSVTRYAEEALHSVPSAQAERHLLPANIAWTILFGWWLALACYAAAAILYVIPKGGRQYARLVWGLGWYLGWPFGKYVASDNPNDDEDSPPHDTEALRASSVISDADTIRGPSTSNGIRASNVFRVPQSPTAPTHASEASALLSSKLQVSLASPRSYGATLSSTTSPLKPSTTELWLGRAVFWLLMVFLIAPLMLIVCIVCWALVVAIPMARLNWVLMQYLFMHPTDIRFCAPPELVYVPVPHTEEPQTPVIPEVDEEDERSTEHDNEVATPTLQRPRLAAGARAPSGAPSSRVLLCIYRAAGVKYYKYTIGGVNILFVNLIPVVFLVILDGFFLMPWVEHREAVGRPVHAILAAIGSRATIFACCLLSVIPLSYFIGMAVASISAQSSIGMGAVINATFGSIIEILLYGIALRDGKGGIVEGSIVGSILAGVLLMPGMSMLSAAVRKKEQKFNAKSAGVTSTMLIMAIIGTLTPTLFYQTYGNVRRLSIFILSCAC